MSAWRCGPRLAEQRRPKPIILGESKKVAKKAAYQYGKGTFMAGEIDPLSRGQQWIALPFLPREMPRDHPYAKPHVSLRAVSAETAAGVRWHVIDAKGLSVGLLSKALAWILQGKHRVNHTALRPPLDRVIVVNAIHVVFAGHTWDTKIYRFERQTHPRGPLEMSAQDVFRRNPSFVLNHCVLKMLPKMRYRRDTYFKKLYVYPGAIHPHAEVPQVVVPHRRPMPFDLQSSSIFETARAVRESGQMQLDTLHSADTSGVPEAQLLADVQLQGVGFSVSRQRDMSDPLVNHERVRTSSATGDIEPHGHKDILDSDGALVNSMHRQHRHLLGIEDVSTEK